MKKEPFTGGKENTQLALSSSKFSLFCLLSMRSRNSFCFEAQTSGYNPSVFRHGEAGDRDLFSTFMFCPCIDTYCHWEDLSEKSSPNSLVPVQREAWREASPVEAGL